jgi:glutathione S-transferase
MENLTLHAFLGDPQCIKILTVAAFLGVEIKLNIVSTSDLRVKKFKNNMHLSMTPALEIGEEKFICTSHAIVRHLIREKQQADGASNFQES